MKYHFDKHLLTDFVSLCDRIDSASPMTQTPTQRRTRSAFQSPTRSTLPLLSLVHHSPQKWTEVLKLIGAPAEATVHFEYSVQSPKPGGNPSQTDIMLISDSAAWAIEAKWTEPRYPDVGGRLAEKRADDHDTTASVNAWLSYLQPFATKTLRLTDMTPVVYQMLHRAASACAVAAERKLKPELVYLVFRSDSKSRNYYMADLQDFYELLGKPCDFRFRYIELPMTETAAYAAIKGLDKDSAATARLIKNAVCCHSLFAFGEPKMTVIA